MSAESDLFSITVEPRRPGGFADQPVEPTVIWLRGEHDASNASYLSSLIAETIALDDEDVVIDLSGASFIGGATIAIFIRANAFLVARSRALILRSPRRYAVRLLGLCGLGHLISPPPEDSVVMTHQSEALRSWVDVPTEERERRRRSDAPPPAPGRVDVSTNPELVTAPEAEGLMPEGD